MTEIHAGAMSLNPFVFHLQKLGLELKCPLCLNLLNWPILLPCDHIFCNSCVNKSPSQCLTCQNRFSCHEMRHSPFLENIVSIYKSLDLAFNSTIFPLLSADSGDKKLFATPGSKLRRKHHETTPDGKSDPPNDFHANCAGSQTESVGLGVNHFSKASPLSIHSSEAGDCIAIDRVGKNGRTESDTSKKSVGSTIPGEVDDENIPLTKRPKKQKKKLDNETPKRVLKKHDCKVKEDTSDSPSTAQLNASNWDLSACAFCHSTEITEWTGPLSYFAGRKEVTRDDTDFPKAIPVHRQCLLWSPQVYYVGDEIQNLETELMRASKLICGKCGLKGASLGCFVESCQKSYHAPCAVNMDCRWDCEAYLMLCPRHVKCKFPNEKSNSGKRRKMGDSPTATESASKWSSDKKWIFCASALSSEEKLTLDKFATICGATVFDIWNPDVTHVITATDSNGACKRTIEVLMAILNGKWVVTTNWIKACLKANCPVNEEPYEVDMDNHGCRNGPRTGRMRAAANAPELFKGLKFFFKGEFAQKPDIFDLVRAGGGAIVDRLEPMPAQKHDAQPQAVLISDGHDSEDSKQNMVVFASNNPIEHSMTMIVFDRDFPQGCGGEEAVHVVLQRLEDAEDFAEGTGAQVIPHTWILESVAASRKLPYPLE